MVMSGGLTATGAACLRAGCSELMVTPRVSVELGGRCELNGDPFFTI